MKWLVALGLMGTASFAGAQTDPGDCECLWQGSFAEVAVETDLVLQAEVTEVKGNAVDIRPLDQYRGETWLDTVRVWMKTGNYCRPPADLFTPGSRWIMALNQIRELPEGSFNPNTPNESYGRRLDYILSGCGGYWLSVRGETASGNLVPGMTRWDHEPDMTPVLIDLVAAYLEDRASVETLSRASAEDPALRALMLDTRSFLRGQEEFFEEAPPENPDG